MIQDILQKYAPMLSKHGVKLSTEEPTTAETKVELIAEATLVDGTMIYTPAPEMAEGVEVYTLDADGNPTPVADGEYSLQDGKVIIVADGKIASISDAPAEEPTVEVTVEQEVSETYSKEQVEGLLNNIISEFEAKLSAAEAKIVELSQAPAAVTVKQAKAVNNAAPIDMLRMTSAQRAMHTISKYK